MENLKSEAKKFILDNSPEWLEAVENGYDLRMEESEASKDSCHKNQKFQHNT